jgi:hypothetical protein
MPGNSDRIDSRNFPISREVPTVERQDVGDTVHQHASNQPGIVNLTPGDARIAD